MALFRGYIINEIKYFLKIKYLFINKISKIRFFYNDISVKKYKEGVFVVLCQKIQYNIYVHRNGKFRIN